MEKLKDMNFFNEFLQAKAKARANRLKAIIAAAVYFGLLILVYIFFATQQMLVRNDLEDITLRLEDEKYAQAARETAVLEAQISALEKYLSALRGVDVRINSLHRYTAAENEVVFNSLPDGVWLNGYEVNGYNVLLKGWAFDTHRIPALTQNLMELYVSDFTGNDAHKDIRIFSELYPETTEWKELDFDPYKELEPGESEPTIPVQFAYALIYEEEDYTVYGRQGYYEFEIKGSFTPWNTEEGGSNQ